VPPVSPLLVLVAAVVPLLVPPWLRDVLVAVVWPPLLVVELLPAPPWPRALVDEVCPPIVELLTDVLEELAPPT
jgi:hypothetical protein